MKISAKKSVAPYYSRKTSATEIRMQEVAGNGSGTDQAVMSLKASSKRWTNTPVTGWKPPTLSSRRGGYHVQGHDDVKSSEEEGVQIGSWVVPLVQAMMTLKAFWKATSTTMVPWRVG